MLRAALPILLAALVADPAAAAGAAGLVFLDADGDGARDAGEPPLAGIRVSNGRRVQTTGADGRYAFEHADDFVFLTRPDDLSCTPWFRRTGGDFPCVPAPTSDEFFFVQISDVHAYDEAADFARYSLPEAPGWLPGRVGAWGMLWLLRSYYGIGRGEIADAFRRALEPYRPTDGLSSSQVVLAYMEEFEREGSELGRIVPRIRAAFAEIAALSPDFVLSTGDQVMEGNTAPADVVEKWFRLYRSLAAETGLLFYNTIGNNEIAGTRNEEFPTDDWRYGKGLFERSFGPTAFSFDRGPFHFVAVDTHVAERDGNGRPGWEFERLGPRVRAWLEADLAAHADRVLVVANHEPFHDMDWSFYEPVDDGGLFAERGVDYAIAGHIHRNGVERRGATTYITSGALSGMRWVVPAGLHPHGYRLYYATGRRLVSAWKATGAPALGFVIPAGDPALHASGEPAAGDGQIEVVAVAADAGGPYARVGLRLDDRALAFERWGDYFLRAALPAGTAGELVLRATRSDGSAQEARLSLPRTAPRSP